MLPLPAEIFSGPPVAPNDLENLGPLRRLAGIWQADKGIDINPKAAGPECRVFREHVRIDPQIYDPQLFYGLRYHTPKNSQLIAILWSLIGPLSVGAGWGRATKCLI